MTIIPEIVGVFCFAGGWTAKQFVARRKVSRICEPNVYPFTDTDHVKCPKCKRGWRFYSGLYCECEECSTGHFHLTCSGKRQGVDGRGCKHTWIMRAADG
jgi:hypothetical protein